MWSYVFLAFLVLFSLNSSWLHQAQAASKKRLSPPVGTPLTSRTNYRFFYHGKLFTTVAIPKSNSEVAIQDSVGNTLWVTTPNLLTEFYASLLEQELDRLFGKPLHDFETNDYLSAQRGFQDLLKLFPNNPYLHYQLGLCYLQLRDIPKAEEALQSSFKLSSDDFEVASELGVLRFETGDYENAIVYFRKGLNSLNDLLNQFNGKEPLRHQPANFGNGQSFQEFIDRLDDKQSMLQQNLVLAYTRQADTLYEQGQQNESLRLLESAMKLLPNRPGLMETYRIYAVYPPVPEAQKQRYQNDLEI
jgi:tetratricopeptide (TPR) repeat protein